MPLLTKEEIIEKTLEEVKLCETDYYNKNSDLLARRIGFNNFRPVRKAFKDAGRLEELEELRRSCQPESHKKLVKEHYSLGLTIKEIRGKIFDSTDTSLDINEINIKTSLSFLFSEGSLKRPSCTTCGKEHDMSFATGRFCRKQYATSYSTSKDKSDLGKREVLVKSKEKLAYRKVKSKGKDNVSDEELELATKFAKSKGLDLTPYKRSLKENEVKHPVSLKFSDFIDYFANPDFDFSEKVSIRRLQELLAFNTVPTKEELKVLTAYSQENKWLLVGDTFTFTLRRSLNPDPEKSDLHNKANEESIRLGIPWFKTPTGKLLNSETQRNLAKERVTKGLHKGWASRGKGLMSYPEKFWKFFFR